MSSKAKEAFARMSAAEIATMTAEANGWQPEDGAELDGVTVAIKSAFSDQKGRNYPIVFVLTDDNECIAVHCFQTVLENEVKSQRPMPGEAIYIKRIGATGPAKPGQSPTIRYAVHVTRDNADADPYAHL